MSSQDTLQLPVTVAVVSSLATEADAIPPGVPPERLYRFSVDEYRQMGKKGVLLNERVELIEGLLVIMSPIGTQHTFVVNKLISILMPLVEPDWFVSPQNPIALPRSEPQPDIAIVRGVPEDYLDRHPGPGDVAILIEVAESSLDYDRRTKGFLYYHHAVSEYWIVNVIDHVLEVYRRESSQQGFTLAEVLDRSKSLPLVLDGKSRGELRLVDILPPARR
jgi:Uma2 family endonuclease